MGTGHHYGMPPEVMYTPPVVQLASDALTYIIRTVHKTLYGKMGYTGTVAWQGYPPRHFQVGFGRAQVQSVHSCLRKALYMSFAIAGNSGRERNHFGLFCFEYMESEFLDAQK